MERPNALPDIRKIVILEAPINEVWKLISTSEGIASWWMANTFQPVLGEEFILHAGPFGDSPCKLTDLNPPTRVGFNWGKDWNLTFQLRPADETRTEFTLIHSGWDPEKVTEFGQSHPVVHGIMDQGWETIIKEKLPASL
ncbi:SRPBCC family protein [Bacillus massiliglaciei]|uniref:SRPBCC family protein n=1 Tax=Bacillus massiliglaciei TaxID=1816693 RepID=UPI000AE7EA8D|nr:SRPBCC domain-containing protein [Bacillus massiliglaciei]